MEISAEDVSLLLPILVPSYSMESATESSQLETSQDETEKRSKRPNWTEIEQRVLVKEVTSREEVLFSKFKGSGRKKTEKDAAWALILQAVNSVAPCVRELDEAKKQYSNLKQRAKEKFSELRRPKTGGGPKPTSPTPVEQVILDGMEGRPSLQGLDGGIDTLDETTSPNGVQEALTYAPLPSTSNQQEDVGVEKRRKTTKGKTELWSVEKRAIEEEIEVMQLKKKKLSLEIEVLELTKTKLHHEIDILERKKSKHNNEM